MRRGPSRSGSPSLPSIGGRGYAREAISFFVRYLFGQLGKYRVTASRSCCNAPSVGMFEAVGMRRSHGRLVDNLRSATSCARHSGCQATGHRPRTRPRRRIETVGATVTRFRPGDDVYAETTTGSFAKLACVAGRLLAPRPPTLPFEQGAAVPVAAVTAVTAWQGLRNVGEVQPSQAVLINGASGGRRHVRRADRQDPRR